MVVVGKGQKLPKIEKYIYPLKQVLMIIEVKSSLYFSKLTEAYENIQSVIDLHEVGRDSVNADVLLDGFKSFTNRELQFKRKIIM